MSIRPTRRQLVQAACAALGAGPVRADEPKPDDRPPLPAAADALLEVVKARHGKGLTDGQLNSIRGRILAGLESGQRLRKLRLTNADEPAFTFSAEVP